MFFVVVGDDDDVFDADVSVAVAVDYVDVDVDVGESNARTFLGIIPLTLICV